MSEIKTSAPGRRVVSRWGRESVAPAWVPAGLAREPEADLAQGVPGLVAADSASAPVAEARE